MQEYYVKNLGWQTAGMQMADVYNIWSATNTVQMISEHTRDISEIKKYLSLGQKARFWYGHRPKNDKEAAYRDAHLGVMIELHKTVHHAAQIRVKGHAGPPTPLNAKNRTYGSH